MNLNGVTKITALTVASNYPENILISAGSNEDGKFIGLIYLLRDERIHTILLSTQPIYNTEQEAIEQMKEVCNELVLLCLH